MTSIQIDSISMYNGILIMPPKRIALGNTENIKDVLKQEIVAFMKTNELSQHTVGKMCDLPAPYVNQILGDKAVSFSKLCEIATKIGMKLTLLIEKK